MSNPSPGGPANATSSVLTLFGLIMLGLVVFGLAALLLNKNAQRTPGEALQHPAVGLPLPGLHVQPVDNLDETVTLADVEGQVVLLNFWATWCPPCRTELPHMDALYRKYQADQQFRLFAVSCGNGPEEFPPELAEETIGFLNHFDYKLPAYLDENFTTRQMLSDPRYIPPSQFGYPTTIIADTDGVIRGVWNGYLPGYEEEMEALVAELLKETGDAPPVESSGDTL